MGPLRLKGENMPSLKALNTRMITVTPTVSNGSAYAANDCVGGLITVTNFFSYPGQTATLNNYTIVDTSAQTAVYQIFFHQNAATIPADNAAWNVSDADGALITGFSLTTTSSPSFFAIGGQSYFSTIYTTHLLPLGVRTTTAGDRNLYISMRTTSTPTFGSTNSLTISMYFEMGI